MPSFKLTVSETVSGKTRLDKYIASVPDGMNRSKLKSGIKQILVNGKAAKLSSKVGAGDALELIWEDSVPEDISPEAIPLDILYEDENVTVVNKKQGMVTHPANGNWSGTLVNALLYHWGKASLSIDSQTLQDARHRPGIVHRLDKDTSGVIITARNRDAEEWLSRQFLTRSHLAKIYIAIVTGRPKCSSGVIETQIVRDSGDRKRFKAVTGTTAGKYACTRYQCIAQYGDYSLMVLRLKTGRTHQIRVHMKYLGCPILGDPIYGRKTAGTVFAEATLMLHAFILKIRLPGEAVHHTFKAPVPARFRKVMRTLHKMYKKADRFTGGSL
ncbi:MAG: RluA family pseudouridine synthase [Treponema sp.]|nr:RluA family pseudouridine synthase [Treponema sp.]